MARKLAFMNLCIYYQITLNKVCNLPTKNGLIIIVVVIIITIIVIIITIYNNL